MKRRLPDDRETAEILATRRTRPAYAAAPPAARAVARLITPFDQKFGGGPQALKSRWKEIVGETLARFTEPVKVSKPRGGGPASLELKVSGPAAALIQHQAPEILQRVNLFLGEGAVDRLRIIQGPITSASPAGSPTVSIPTSSRPRPMRRCCRAGSRRRCSACCPTPPPHPRTAPFATLCLAGEIAAL